MVSALMFDHHSHEQAQCKVSCILLWYPLFTQPFIFREVENIKKLLPVSVYTLYGKNLRHCSDEMRSAAEDVHTNGLRVLPQVLATLVREFIIHPKRFICLFRRLLWKKWPSLEIFGENLWAFCMGFYLAPKLKKTTDILYAPWPRGTATAALVINQLTNIPFGITVRGDNLNPADPDLAEKMQAACFVRTNNHADQLRIAAFANGVAATKTELIYNSLTLDHEAATPHIASYSFGQPLKLMALGRFDVTKGFDVLLKAAALLCDLKLNFSLTLAGGGGIAMGLGNLEGKLLDLTNELKLQDVVSYPGLISHNELPKLLSQHDIFVAPCVIDPSGRRDGIPNTIIEAMSMGLPVVSSNIHALPEVVLNNKTGLTVPPNDPSALCQAIFWLAQHPLEAAEMGRCGQEHAKHLFDSKRNAAKLAALLQAKAGV